MVTNVDDWECMVCLKEKPSSANVVMKCVTNVAMSFHFFQKLEIHILIEIS